MSADFDAPRTLIATDGTRIHYRVAGPVDSKRPAVVLLHGLASNQTRFSEFVEFTSLRRTRRVIRVDLRGHGLSVARPPGRLETWCSDLAAVLVQEAVERVAIVGHSLGAQVALYFAAAFSERMAGLVLIDPVFRSALKGSLTWYARFGWVLRALVPVVSAANTIGLGRRDPLPLLDLRELDARARQALKSPKAEADFIAHYSSTRADLRHVHVAQYLQDLTELFRSPPALETLTMPVLLLLSSGATFAHALRTAHVIARFPDVVTQTIDCHHWPLTERPVEVREAIERWCEVR